MAALDQRVVSFTASTGKEETIPALDSRRVERRGFVKYAPPLKESEAFPSSADERQVFEEWKERMSYIVEDLNWLLKLPHDLFWCQVIFDASLHQLLDSFLLYAPRHYDKELIKDYCKPIHSKVCKFIFLTIVRMSADKESDENYISSTVYGEIIYENFLFDIPKLLDICSILYGKEDRNRDILSKIVHNVFNKQPRYLDDLEDALSTLFDTLNQMSEKLGLDSELARNGPIKLSDREAELSLAEVMDISLYLYDVCNTIYPFLASYPPAAKIFERKNAFTRFAFLYDTLFPEVIAKLKCASDQLWLLQCRKATKCILGICHLILKHSIPDDSQSSPKNDIGHGKLEMFVHAMSSVLTYKRFLCDYDKLYGVESDFNNLTCESECVDRTHITFVLDAVKSAKQELQIPDAANSPAGSVTKSSSHDLKENDIGEKLTRLLDVLPGFDSKLLERSLRHFSGDEAAAANAILEGSLPAELNSVPQENDTLQAMPSSSTMCELDNAGSTEGAGRSLGAKARGRVYRKQNNVPDDDVLSILSDRENRDYVLGYVDKLEQKVFGFDEYDDEYDDTYDSQNVGAIDADSADELGDLTARRGFVTPMVLRKPGDNRQDDKDDSSSPEENSDRDKKLNAVTPNSGNAPPQTASKSLRGGTNSYKDTPSFQSHSGKGERSKIKDGKENRKNERDHRFQPRGGKADDRGSKRHYGGRGTGSGKGRTPSRGNSNDRGNRGQHWKESHSRRDVSPNESHQGRDDIGQSGLAAVETSWGGAVEGEEANSAARGAYNPNETADRSERETFWDRDRQGNAGWRGGDSWGRGEKRGGGNARGNHRGKWHDKHHRKDKAAQKFARGMGPLPRD